MREHASPMPDAPPVTMATLPWSLELVMVDRSYLLGSIGGWLAPIVIADGSISSDQIPLIRS